MSGAKSFYFATQIQQSSVRLVPDIPGLQGQTILKVLTNPDIGVISIASYDNFHCDQIVLALEHSKHVFVEKPLCLMQEELDDIIGQLRCNPDLKLSSNLILRKTPRFIELRERLQCGALGVPYYWEGDYDYGRLHKITEGWRSQIPYYSVVHGGAIHLLDLIWWLSGKKVLRVHSIGNNLATANTEYKRQSLVTTILDFDDGSTACLLYTSPSPRD